MALFSNPKAFANDKKGLSLPYSSLTFYQSGTVILQPVYSDSGLGFQIDNPVIADENGIFPQIYINDTLSYTVVLSKCTRPGVYEELYSVDDYPLAPSDNDTQRDIVGSNEAIYYTPDVFDYLSFCPDSSSRTPNGGADFSGDGTKVYIAQATTGFFKVFTLSTAYDLNSRDSGVDVEISGLTSMRSIKFNSDGSKIMVLQNLTGTDGLRVYTLGTNYDLSTASLSQSLDLGNNNHSGLYVSPDGLNLFSCDKTNSLIEKRVLSSDFNIAGATISETFESSDGLLGTPNAVCFSDDGLTCYATQESSGVRRLVQYKCTTAFSLSSINGSYYLDIVYDEDFTDSDSDNRDWLQIAFFSGGKYFSIVRLKGVSIYPASYLRAAGSTTGLFSLPKTFQNDKTGRSVQGQLEFFTTDSYDQEDVYSDSDLQNVIAQPIKSDADGVYPIIHLDDAISYRCIYSERLSEGRYKRAWVADEINKDPLSPAPTSSQLLYGPAAIYDPSAIDLGDFQLLGSLSFRDVFIDPGGNFALIMTGTSPYRIVKYDFATQYVVSGATLSDTYTLSDSLYQSFDFSIDGTRLFLMNQSIGTEFIIEEYSLSSAFDISSITGLSSTATYSSSIPVKKLRIIGEGSQFLVMEDNGSTSSGVTYSAYTNYDISTLTQTGSISLSAATLTRVDAFDAEQSGAYAVAFGVDRFLNLFFSNPGLFENATNTSTKQLDSLAFKGLKFAKSNQYMFAVDSTSIYRFDVGRVSR